MIDGVPAADRYLFDLEGYLVIEDALDATQLAAVNDEIDRLLEDADPDAPAVSFGAGGGELVGERGVFLDLVDNPRVAPHLEALVDPDVRLDHEYVHVLRPGIGATGLSSAVLHGGGTPFDASQWFRFADGRTWSGLTVVAYHLRDVDPADGGLAIVPGSHKANLPFPDEWRDLDLVRHPSVRRVGGRAGTAVVFSEASTHGTLPWHGAGERRTLFYKYSPHPISWSWRYYDLDALEPLTERQRRLLEAPNGRSPRRLERRA